MKKILVVDDDKTLQLILKRHLENQGYLVKIVDSGVEALRACEQDTPDLVVSDVMMPGMNGLEFCKKLRSSRFGQLVPFIFLSSKGELEDRIKGHSMGADDYVTKPFHARELLAKIEAQLERSHRIHSEMIRLMQNLAGDSPINHPPKLENQPESTIVPTEVPSLPLTPAEARVFWEVIQGLTNKQISDRLFISPRTVQTHLSNILNKLNLDNRSQLVRFAFEQGHRPPEGSSEHRGS